MNSVKFIFLYPLRELVDCNWCWYFCSIIHQQHWQHSFNVDPIHVEAIHPELRAFTGMGNNISFLLLDASFRPQLVML